MSWQHLLSFVARISEVMGGERCDFDWRQHSLNIPNKIHVNEFVKCRRSFWRACYKLCHFTCTSIAILSVTYLHMSFLWRGMQGRGVSTTFLLCTGSRNTLGRWLLKASRWPYCSSHLFMTWAASTCLQQSSCFATGSYVKARGKLTWIAHATVPNKKQVVTRYCFSWKLN